MKLRLDRNWLIGNTTIGKLFINGKFFCYTLEDKVRNHKVYGQTAIPYGQYEVDITYSNKFKKQMPLIKDVPGFEGIRIHRDWGGGIDDTAGCLLVGSGIDQKNGKFVLTDSENTYNKLFEVLNNVKADKEDINIKIVMGDKKRLIGLVGGGIAMIGLSIWMYFKYIKK